MSLEGKLDIQTFIRNGSNVRSTGNLLTSPFFLRMLDSYIDIQHVYCIKIFKFCHQGVTFFYTGSSPKTQGSVSQFFLDELITVTMAIILHTESNHLACSQQLVEKIII
jgi:hypothetical protein